MERLYLYLVQTHRGNTIHTETFKSMIEKMYKNPEKAIESRLYLNIESFALIDLDNDKSITDAEFLSFIDNCFISLMAIAEKDIPDRQYKMALRDWVMKNKKSFYDGVLATFNKYKRSDPHKWGYADFKRWVMSKENWTLDVSVGVNKYRTPLNLLCFFGIPLQSWSKFTNCNL